MSQGFRDRWGIGWYKKTLNIEEKNKGKRYLLYFGGVYENVVLWVNGMKIGSHKYGYSSFKMDITDAVQSGDNELLMRVDNSVSPADRWYSGCGIYRDVTLRIVPENHLDLWNIQVHSKIEKIAETECAKDSKETESAAKFTAAIQVETGQSSAVQGILRLIQNKENESLKMKFSLQRERMECLPSILKMQSFGQQKIRIFIV